VQRCVVGSRLDCNAANYVLGQSVEFSGQCSPATQHVGVSASCHWNISERSIVTAMLVQCSE
jgi:hypothetical protein